MAKGGAVPVKPKKAVPPAHCNNSGAQLSPRRGLPLRVSTGMKCVIAPRISGAMPTARTRWATAGGDRLADCSSTSAAMKTATAERPR